MAGVQPLQPNDPRQLGAYQLRGRLGKGGQGVVFLGQAPDGSQAAVKTLDTEGASDPSYRERFVREAEAAQQVASFCTAAVLTADFTSAPPYIVSEFVDGPSLRQAVGGSGPLHGGDLNRLAVAIATALVAIHEAGVIHRDLKPANVLLGPGGARVIDFGIARITGLSATQTGSTVGTPSFMAPEQINGRSVTPAADVFSWGAVIAYAATGRQPFAGETVQAVLHQVFYAEPDLTGVPEPLRGLVAACMRKDPAQRPSSVDVLMTLLGRQERPSGYGAMQEVLAGATATVSDPSRFSQGPTMQSTQSAFPVSKPKPGPKPNRLRNWLMGAGAVVVVALALLGAYALGGGFGGAQPGGDPSQGPSGGPSTGSSAESSATGESETGDDNGNNGDASLPTFGSNVAGEWSGEGMFDDALHSYSVTIEEGARTAHVTIDEECGIDLAVTGVPEDIYKADATDTGPLDCPSYFNHAEVSPDGGLLRIELWYGEADGGTLLMEPR